ncbi:hypothetical protein JCM4914_65070 [Streptomyces platensis subsp. malvinus]
MGGVPLPVRIEVGEPVPDLLGRRLDAGLCGDFGHAITPPVMVLAGAPERSRAGRKVQYRRRRFLMTRQVASVFEE